MIKQTALILSTALILAAAPISSVQAQDLEAAKAALDKVFPGKFLHNPVAIDWDRRGNDKKIKIVEADTPSGQAISARTKKRKTNAWDIALSVDLEDGVKKGDEVEIQFWARTAKAPKARDTAEIVVFVGRNEEPYDYIISEDFEPGAEWKLHKLKGTAKGDFPDGEIKAEFQLGKHAQTVEFGALYVSNLSAE